MEKMRPIYKYQYIWKKQDLIKTCLEKIDEHKKGGYKIQKTHKRQQSGEFGEKVSIISYKKWSQEAEAFHSACA